MHTCCCHNKDPFPMFTCFLILLLVAVVERFWSIVLLNTFQHFRNKYVCKLHRSTTLPYGVGVLKKGLKYWILNRFLLVNSEMWIRTAIKLPHDLGVCQKTVGNSAGDFTGVVREKTDILDSDGIKITNYPL